MDTILGQIKDIFEAGNEILLDHIHKEVKMLGKYENIPLQFLPYVVAPKSYSTSPLEAPAALGGRV